MPHNYWFQKKPSPIDMAQPGSEPASTARDEERRARRMDRLRVRHLRLLHWVAETGSLSAAAERLQVSQPGATKMLQEIEAALGVGLIERSARGARLSPAGRVALDRLRVALGALDAAAGADAALATPVLRMGILPLVAVAVLPAVTAAIDAAGQLPRLVLREANVDQLMRLLRDGEVDCVIGRLEAGEDAPGDLQIERLWEERMAIAAAPGHPLAGRRRHTLATLQAERWILPPPATNTRRNVERWFLESGLQPPAAAVESTSFHTSLALAGAGRLLAVAPQTAVEHYEARGVVKALALQRPLPSGPMFFITRAELAPLPQVVQWRAALVGHVRQAAAGA